MEHAAKGSNATLTIDLESQIIQGPESGNIAFEIDEFKRHCLLNGLDDVGLTMQVDKKIDDFENRQRSSQPWLYAAT